jgi:hypothetical protein
MYEAIDEEHRKIRHWLTNASLKRGLGYSSGYIASEGYLYSANYSKRCNLLAGLARFGFSLRRTIWDAGMDAYYDQDRVLIPPAKEDSYSTDLSHPHVRVIIPRLGEVLVVFARVQCPEYGVVWYDNPAPVSVGVLPYMGDYLTTEALIDNLKALMQYAKGYAQCGCCHYSGDHTNYCGVGEVMYTGTCTKGQPLLTTDSHGHTATTDH